MRHRQIVNKVLGVAMLLGLAMSGSLQAFADSTVIDGPGFKLQKSHGWFGRESHSYQDAMGNTLETKKGFFGCKSTRTKLFGSEAIKHGNNVSVKDANGNPLVSTRRTLFGGKQTRVDGNQILNSLKGVLTPSP